jgi:hypothetical protein
MPVSIREVVYQAISQPFVLYLGTSLAEADQIMNNIVANSIEDNGNYPTT